MLGQEKSPRPLEDVVLQFTVRVNENVPRFPIGPSNFVWPAPPEMGQETEHSWEVAIHRAFRHAEENRYLTLKKQWSNGKWILVAHPTPKGQLKAYLDRIEALYDYSERLDKIVKRASLEIPSLLREPLLQMRRLEHERMLQEIYDDSSRAYRLFDKGHLIFESLRRGMKKV